ncbi:unnamed protein product [Zymoseptoria tritici ST99CH_1E4]|uniref:C2H2-type domain-containing protein n=1 Tax=Zymoseptoria tritici ST99CH_1E4 TaxID=1276532 RepID=A0A2H1GTI9_ZYMTR|nr:unnamed protein product [Zymoseptoria tritici ST99CH_1E4]
MSSSTAYGCTQCSIATPSLTAINTHINTSNNEKRLWRCPGCASYFCLATNLKGHFPLCQKFYTWRTTMKWGRDLDKNSRVQSACDIAEKRAGATAESTFGPQKASQTVAAPTPTPSKRALPKRVPPKKTYDNGQQQISKRRKGAAEEEQPDEDPAQSSEAQESPPKKRLCRSRETTMASPSAKSLEREATSSGNASSGNSEVGHQHSWQESMDDGPVLEFSGEEYEGFDLGTGTSTSDGFGNPPDNPFHDPEAEFLPALTINTYDFRHGLLGIVTDEDRREEEDIERTIREINERWRAFNEGLRRD